MVYAHYHQLVLGLIDAIYDFGLPIPKLGSEVRDTGAA